MMAQELKKIFDRKRVLLVLFLGIIFYILFFQKNIGVPVYSSERIDLELSLDLMDTYGYEIDEAEYAKLQHEFEVKQTSKVDAWIKEQATFQEHGIGSYEELLAKQDSFSDEIASMLTSLVATNFTEKEQQEALDFVWRKEYIENLLTAYDTEIKDSQKTSYDTEIPENAQSRIAKRGQEEIYSIMPDSIMRKYLAVFPDFTVFLFLSIILLVVPYSVKDTMEGIPILQYGSRKGCRYYWKKLFAVFFAALLLCVVEIGFLAFMLNKSHVFSFWNCFVSGFRNPFISVLKATFGQYIIASIAYSVVIGLCLALVTYCLSSCARNYISAIALQIPVIVFSIAVSLLVMSHFAEITQNITVLLLILIICIVAAMIGNAARFISIRFFEQM